MKKQILVIGGGPAGMMAAIAAATYGGEDTAVTLLEKNEKLGKKIYITGKGRCNFTNACETEDFFANVVSNPKFLYSAIYGFDARQVMDFMEENGTPIKVERGNRAFPASDHASDITKALKNALDRQQVRIRLQTRVTAVTKGPDGGFHVDCVEDDSRRRVAFDCDRLIVATGGLSYPSTGSTGDGYAFCESLGMRVQKAGPGLVPLVTEEDDIRNLQGLSLKNVTLTAFDERGKKIYDAFGEMLFTHFGVSGPLVLTLSSRAGRLLDAGQRIRACIDLKPALTQSMLEERLIREMSQKQNKQMKHFFDGILPSKLIPVFLQRLADCGISEDLQVNSMTRQMRSEVIRLMKAFPFTIIASRGFAEAIITRGGVETREIDPSTMEAKEISGLYLAGEMIDVDALTGGYNMQIAFSTGYLAGMNAACSLQETIQ